ncbi:hypothetical protein BOTBODRAFT_55683 [Botryobasidium botryosum FD-172 SS1]|uniref:Serine hydrolase domain-containing protein n=1 Tax=Botryobasidium botryosum (strain FD-172 SS1) TaxID=930990 RepID=A0A067MGW2_BOTB1|nr:hypothetical protein BOTBODRAFT_55683 [Botryobasidium botryosum FD-172 SS1]
MTRRILLLHGYSQNKTILYKKISAVRKACKDCEFVFVDAPHVVDPEGDDPHDHATVDLTDPTLTPRAWWPIDPVTQAYTSVEETMVFLRDLLAKDRFHGVFGFSQGTAVAAVLCAVLERPHLYPSFMVDGVSPHPPFEFAIFVSGFKPIRSDILPPLFVEPIKTPTLHVVGRGDAIIPPERAQTLIDACVDPRVEWHEGGHFIPSNASWRRFFAAYITNSDPNATAERLHVPSPLSADVSTATTPNDTRSVTPSCSR